MTKGVVKLVPIDKPVEGMQATTLFFGQQVIVTIKKLLDAHCIIYGKYNEHIVQGEYPLPELKQIVIEVYSSSTNKASDRFPINTLPLHPSDWEAALPLIGKEVEIELVNGGLKYPCSPVSENCVGMAKLIFPKQEETWMDIWVKWQKQCTISTSHANGLQEFLEKFYSPPKRIKQ